MAEYIDREQVLSMSYCANKPTWDNPYLDPKSVVNVDDIEALPVADVQEIKHGEWLPNYETFTDCNGFESEPIQTDWVCSVCGRQESRKEPYCHCGALMSNDCEDEKR